MTIIHRQPRPAAALREKELEEELEDLRENQVEAAQLRALPPSSGVILATKSYRLDREANPTMPRLVPTIRPTCRINWCKIYRNPCIARVSE